MFDALFTTTTEYKKLSHALSGKGACALFGLPASGRAQVVAWNSYERLVGSLSASWEEPAPPVDDC